jgi:hypothetical protein
MQRNNSPEPLIADLWLELPPGCVVLMMARGGPPKTAAERARARYWREKSGLSTHMVDLPPDALRRYLIDEGWVSADEADDPDEIRAATSRLVQDLIGFENT